MKSYSFKMLIILTLLVMYPFIGHSTDLKQLHASDYEAFWKQWNKSKEKALTCKDQPATSEFLSNAVIMLGNAEVEEANAEVIEELCLEKPRCILEALIRMKKDEQDKLLRFFITSPIFHKAGEIKASLEKHWSQPKYQKIRNLYVKMEQSS
jgi:hypothetical protein